MNIVGSGLYDHLRPNIPELADYRIEVDVDHNRNRSQILCLDGKEKVGEVQMGMLGRGAEVYNVDLPEFVDVLSKSWENGINTYVTYVFITKGYQGKGIGAELVFQALNTIRFLSFNHLVRDISNGWAMNRALPYVRSRMEENGYTSSELWKAGLLVNKVVSDASLVNYRKV